ncbi:TetR/AcrR family transcriptional regulator [Streptomyces sp. NPDC026672]|uniref:TetR/AcrR family transcriptional regulator n=1 Tax=unclassified Streptomyces TaxID=2593676 RepID=UPI00340CEEC0
MSGKRVEQLHAQGERTRARLLEVAREAFAADGAVSLNAVAKAAGVGIGTLYRHFPTREELVFELYRHEVHQLAASADELLAVSEPAVALRDWLDGYARYVMAKAGLVRALRGAATHGRFVQEAYGPVAAAIDRLLAANERAGTVRPGFTADDVLLAVDGLYNLDPDSDWPPRAARLFDLVVTGLRGTN